MANAVKIKKIVEVLLINGTPTELDTYAMPCNVYVLSSAKGVYKFTNSEEIYLEFKRKKEEKNAKRKAAQAEKKAKEEEEKKMFRNGEETFGTKPQGMVEAENLNLSYVKGNVFSEIFANSNGEQFMWLPKNKVFISLSPITSESGEAFLGEICLGAKSPEEYSHILESIQAEIPTQEQYEEFAGILMKLTGTATIEGFMRVCSYISFEHQLCIDGNGNYKTYLNERANLIKTYPWYNLAVRKVLKQRREA